MILYCPHCGGHHKSTRREEMFIELHGYVARMCDYCKQTYWFDKNGIMKRNPKVNTHE